MPGKIENENLASASRRQWLKASVAIGGGLVLGVSLVARATESRAEIQSIHPNVPWGAPPQDLATRFGAYLEIGTNGRVLFHSPVIEMGQGAQSSLAAVIADELDLAFDHIDIQVAPAGTAYQRPDVTKYQLTSGSWSLRLWYDPMRRAGATARMMLIAAAARQWEVEPQSCLTEEGYVRHPPSGRAASYGELASLAATMPVPEEVAFKSRDQLKLVGQRLHRLDLPAKVDGSAVYGIDVRVPGLAYAALRQAPVYGAEVVSVNDDALRLQPGIITVLRVPSGVVVVAENWWQAKKAVEQLEVQFASTAYDGVSSASLAEDAHNKLGQADSAVFRKVGDVDLAQANAAKRLTADYGVQFLHHAPMEPMNCTARVTDDTCELWVPTQCHTTALEAAQRLTGLPEASVNIHATLLGGAFGRRIHTDFIEPAILAAQAVNRPVKLLWSREEDMSHGYHRPAMAARMVATLDQANEINSLTMRIAGPSVHEKFWPSFFKDGLDYAAVMALTTKNAASGSHYETPNLLIDYVYQPTHVPIGYWRSVGASHNGFFMESFIDELAETASEDPGAFRRKLLRNSPRGLEVLDRVMQVSQWARREELPEGEGLGIAFFEAVDSIVAQVAHVSVAQDQLRVHKVWAVIDCGQTINPDTIEAQMEGGILQSLSATLFENITIEQGRCQQTNFHDYPLLRMGMAPEIEVHTIESDKPLGGVGEAMVPTLAPAVCNAIYDACGRRIRTLPLCGQGIRVA